MAHTYYERARRANGKADYEKSVTLFKEVIEKGFFFDDDRLYPYLTNANHELGSDQNTRNYLEQKLQKNPADINAGEALISLCVNYLKDLECADQNITKFESGLYSRGTKVRKLELHVLRGEYQEAEKLLLDIGSPTSVPNEVTLFYQTWTLHALAREKDAQNALRRWQGLMDEVRRSGESILWVFDAARRALDAAAKLSTSQKDLLRNMIGAMEDNTRPLPK
ncbi:MAG TPA: hypothetical protein VFM05_04605 [Candidatus Saccharimonadales bacterium]|nr:hypothetical protein [Candidatus Saccharimonadales bacterium]